MKRLRSCAPPMLLSSGVLLCAWAVQQLPDDTRTVQLTLVVDVRAGAVLAAAAVLVSCWIVARRDQPTAEDTAPQEQTAEPVAKRVPSLIPKPEALSLPEPLLRALITWQQSADDPDVQALECPVCSDVMLNPQRTSCNHHACTNCLANMQSCGFNNCPRCADTMKPNESKDADDATMTKLAALQCKCSACQNWEGCLADLLRHFLCCNAARGVMAVRQFSNVVPTKSAVQETRKGNPVEKLLSDMAGASPALVHRFTAEVVERTDGQCSAPIFSACNYLWCLRMGPLASSSQGTRYFVLMPHGHEKRLKCSFFFAKKGGEGYKERRIHDWPAELAGHPWGPTLQTEELADCKQADGSVIFMIHAVGLCDGDSSHF